MNEGFQCIYEIESELEDTLMIIIKQLTTNGIPVLISGYNNNQTTVIYVFRYHTKEAEKIIKSLNL